MNTKLLASVLAVCAVAVLRAQEPEAISPDDLAKVVPMLMEENARLGNQPLKLELDSSKAAGFKAKDVGAIFIPDKRLKAEKGDRADKLMDALVTIRAALLPVMNTPRGFGWLAPLA
jgi:hypothetical protein